MKNVFWKTYVKALLGRVPYIILGFFFYPFIKRTKTREKYYSGRGGWYNRQLWYMLNDDEIERYGVDWDVKKINEVGINTSTKWGRFIASYWFNAIRNPGYNYALTKKPVNPKGNYGVVEVEINDLYKNYEKVTPLYWAQWRWVNNMGVESNKGNILAYNSSVVGEGKIWFHPNNRKDLLYCRWSFANRKNIWLWDIYYVFQCGAFSDKYDIKFKWKVIKR
jgi:hypothetical protein